MSKQSKVTQEGYAWAESGRSEYDVIAVVDWCKLEFEIMDEDTDEDAPEFLAYEADVCKRMREAFDDDTDQFRRLFEDDAYAEEWLLGVIAFYCETIEPQR